MRHRKLLLVILSLCCFGRSADAQPGTHAFDNIHSIGLISALTPAVAVPWGAIPLDWDINADVTRLLTGGLKDRFDVTPVAMDREMLQKAFSDDKFRGLGKFLLANPQPGVDAYLVVLPDKVPTYTAAVLPLVMSHSFFPGLAIQDDSDLFHPHANTNPYATYDLIVFEARTGALLGWSRGRGSDEGGPHFGAIGTFCKNGFLPASAGDISREKIQSVLDEMKILVFSGIPRALRLMGLLAQVDLAGMMPAQPALCSTLPP
jgi:hypothetical protein